MFIRPIFGGLGPEWNDLVLAYELDGDDATSLLDAGPNGYDLTDAGGTGTPTSAVGKIDDSREAPQAGTGQYVYRLNTNDLLFNSDEEFTILCWDYTTYLANGHSGQWTLVNQSAEASFATSLTHIDGSGVYQLNWKTVPTGDASMSSGSFTTAQWVFVMVKYDGAGTMSMSFNDGTPVTTGSTSHRTNDLGFIINLWQGSFVSGGNRLDGFRLFNRALSASEISLHYNSGNGLAYPG